MNNKRGYIASICSGIGFFLMLLLLSLFASCSSDKDNDEGGGVQQEPTVLQIYVFSPSNPIVTRANTGPVDAAYEKESIISSLHIWVYPHNTDANYNSNVALGCITLSPDEITNFQNSGAGRYTMVVTDDFANAPVNVDVYVLANVSGGEYGLPATLDESTSKSDLQAAMIKKNSDTDDPFGVSAVTTVGALSEDGLPMSGVLIDQPVVGNPPILRIGTAQQVATARLTRAVSKMRFVFCQASDMENQVKITGVTLAAAQIPNQEHLFLKQAYDGRTCNIPDAASYNDAAFSLPNMVIDYGDLPPVEDPSKYSYNVQEGQDYEDLINAGINATPKELVEKGPFYFRESDKQLTGTIYYTLKSGTTTEDKYTTFTMSAAGDFSRNHTWIVYASYSASLLDVLSVQVVDWSKQYSSDWEFYNW